MRIQAAKKFSLRCCGLLALLNWLSLPDGGWSIVEHYDILTKTTRRMSCGFHKLLKNLALLKPSKFFHRVNDKPGFVSGVLNVVFIKVFHKRKSSDAECIFRSGVTHL